MHATMYQKNEIGSCIRHSSLSFFKLYLLWCLRWTHHDVTSINAASSPQAYFKLWALTLIITTCAPLEHVVSIFGVPIGLENMLYTDQSYASALSKNLRKSKAALRCFFFLPGLSSCWSLLQSAGLPCLAKMLSGIFTQSAYIECVRKSTRTQYNSSYNVM